MHSSRRPRAVGSHQTFGGRVPMNDEKRDPEDDADPDPEDDAK